MQLSEYISDLLYRYECVIVPNFGGFVSNAIPSKRNVNNHHFTPPTKAISFNVNLQKNDGLLVNHIAKSLNVNFDTAAEMVQKTVEEWRDNLQKSTLLLTNIGEFTLENEQLVFEPLNKVNYLASSFGLSTVKSDFIFRNEIEAETPEEKSKKPYLKYITSAAVVVGFLFVGGSIYYNQQQINKQEIADQQAVTNKIQQASFNILKPLPGITLTVEKEVVIEEVIQEEITYKYHIVAGAFKDPENADKKVSSLKAKGYDASIIGLNRWGLIQVSYASFNDKDEATKTMISIRKKDNKHAWLFINK